MKAEYKAVLENLSQDAHERVWQLLKIIVKDSANAFDDAALLALEPMLKPIGDGALDKIDGVVGDATAADDAPADPASGAV